MKAVTLFLLLLCFFSVRTNVDTYKKRILLNDPDYNHNVLQSIQAMVQNQQSQLSQYQSKLTVYETKLTGYEAKLATQELELVTQSNKLTQQEHKLADQEKLIQAQENKLLQQERNITSQEKTINQQEMLIAEQQSKIVYQQSVISNITTDLRDVMYHNFFDEMAQATCTSNTDQRSYVYAIRRDCGGGKGHAPTCNDICTAAGHLMYFPNGHNECFDALGIQKVHSKLVDNPGYLQPDAGKPFMFVYRYLTGGCTWPADHCGPNYCCCRSY